MYSHHVSISIIQIKTCDRSFGFKSNIENFEGVVSKVPLNRVGIIPVLLNPTVKKTLELPLEEYQLRLEDIYSIALLSHQYSNSKFILSLTNSLTINHPEPLFHTQDLTACLFDQRTVITSRQI